ncbi:MULTISPECIES: MaoC/PaaZ C-terminal domain-containing protein [unclassified Nocardioides]|uniref:MaoC family dehydratase n=1 Tax=unclassified Nocardioides TaxID=2615069 RepID=UPI0021B37A2A|nr:MULTISPECIES: MaoC/PaaZ C-terminal domain-containing protein [unclassified Nocardioides]WGX99804.1 MaoC/PaaZ C-terminal domain-containing protein [Nocardioides sp. QY071]
MALPVMLKAALPAVPGVNQLPGIKKTGGALPDLTLSRDDVLVERSAVERYAAVCGFPNRDVAPVPYLHMLAFPLHMQLMTDAKFPFPAIGSVHLENTIVQHRPVAIGETVSLSLKADNLRASTKGRAWDMNVTGTVGEEVVWESVSTYLRVGKGDKENGDPGMSLSSIAAKGPVWSIPENIGRTYGAVSGDRNPIHLYPLTAKALGFPRHIAHGMWSKARCIAALENRLPDAVKVEVAFKKPIFLPGKAQFGAEANAAGYDFTLVNPKSGAPHLLGRTTAL